MYFRSFKDTPWHWISYLSMLLRYSSVFGPLPVTLYTTPEYFPGVWNRGCLNLSGGVKQIIHTSQKRGCVFCKHLASECSIPFGQSGMFSHLLGSSLGEWFITSEQEQIRVMRLCFSNLSRLTQSSQKWGVLTTPWWGGGWGIICFNQLSHFTLSCKSSSLSLFISFFSRTSSSFDKTLHFQDNISKNVYLAFWSLRLAFWLALSTTRQIVHRWTIHPMFIAH